MTRTGDPNKLICQNHHYYICYFLYLLFYLTVVYLMTMIKFNMNCLWIKSRSPVSPPGKSVWVLWWWEWPWDRFSSGAPITFQQYFTSYLFISYPRPILKMLIEINAKEKKTKPMKLSFGKDLWGRYGGLTWGSVLALHWSNWDKPRKLFELPYGVSRYEAWISNCKMDSKMQFKRSKLLGSVAVSSVKYLPKFRVEHSDFIFRCSISDYSFTRTRHRILGEWNLYLYRCDSFKSCMFIFPFISSLLSIWP
jgi:hypothetical protein